MQKDKETIEFRLFSDSPEEQFKEVEKDDVPELYDEIIVLGKIDGMDLMKCVQYNYALTRYFLGFYNKGKKK